MRAKTLPRFARRSLLIEKAITEACERFSVSRSAILSGAQDRNTSHARKAVCQTLKTQGFNYSKIARSLNVDRRTVIYHCQQMFVKAPYDPLTAPADESGVWAI
jgi:transcriptional regulator with GAF, ATPase, and Fis domain